jgi:REP element-mobilizing transposase RayT
MSSLSYKFVYRRNLPHIQPPGATLFVTTRLYGSLPIEMLQYWQKEAKARERLLASLPPDEQAERRYLEERRFFGRYDAELDRAATGPTWLRDPAVASAVMQELRNRDGVLYDLEACTIMSNHIHAVFAPLLNGEEGHYALPWIMHGLKRGSAWAANAILKRKGPFWQHESYDHYVRDTRELERIVYYVLNNPVKAGLVESWEEWPWTYWKYAADRSP